VAVFECGVTGRTTETILANLTEEYFEAEVDALAEEKVRKQTIEQFREEVGSFDNVDFEDK